MLILIFVIIFTVIVIATDTKDLNYYNDIYVNVSIGSKININPESNNYIIEDFTADLSVFPRHTDSEYQSIKEEYITSFPDTLTSANENSILYSWSKPKEKELIYKYNANIYSKIKFIEVKEKVKFPLIQDNLPEEIKQYTEPDEFIESDNPEIIQLANQLAEGSDDLYGVVFKISKWTNSNINYSLETLTAELQQSSLWVLQNKKGVCDELTVLTIAMLRSLGAPTKFVSGSSYTDLINGFGNHAWFEVYFPKYGWVQFDPTYGQYGFVDATHIKLKASKKAKEGAVNYAWRSRDVTVQPEKLSINVSVLEKGKKLLPLIDLKIKPLKNKVSSGSFIPFEINIENKNDFYIPVTLYITKAPTQIFNNKIELLLRPYQIKNEYFFVKIPDDIKEGFTYTSAVEVVDFFGSLANTEIEFSKIYELYPEDKAKELINSLREEEQKIYSRDVSLNCSSDKSLYYTYENKGRIKCQINNNGNTNIEEIKICLLDNCQKLNISIAKSKKIEFLFALDKSKDLAIVAENEDILKHSFVSVKILESPDLQITRITYKKIIPYKDNNEILFTVNAGAPVNNLIIDVDKKNIFFLYNLNDEAEFKIPFEGSYFFNKESKLKIKYKDENGKDYYLEQPINITVTDIPFFPRLIAKIKNLF